jgi:hypothetical protein
MVFLIDICGGRLLGFENGARFLVRDLEALAQPRRSFGCTSSRGGFSIRSRFLGHTGLLTTFSILAATEHPPLRATPHRRVLPVTLLADETALLLGEAHEAHVRRVSEQF